MSNNVMDQAKKERLESKGWKIGTVSDFLELTTEESIFVEIKLVHYGVSKITIKKSLKSLDNLLF